jgi:hypothetical protein
MLERQHSAEIVWQLDCIYIHYATNVALTAFGVKATEVEQ